MASFPRFTATVTLLLNTPLVLDEPIPDDIPLRSFPANSLYSQTRPQTLTNAPSRRTSVETKREAEAKSPLGDLGEAFLILDVNDIHAQQLSPCAFSFIYLHAASTSMAAFDAQPRQQPILQQRMARIHTHHASVFVLHHNTIKAYGFPRPIQWT
ncbi:hypothetical protein FISHEDRAFT_61849 [Fistulina hepatica ATCC 64428]|uniref:Uncharacterized protein n=1 Tax=Fistulina hepatica ATCC 64428 TaxID=1128425 RepID=A0A0D7A2H8_9AGAR|nr:hypothetical protein FISHEDRAFT_61849 [Fistulina hepatica ATCC 64428]